MTRPTKDPNVPYLPWVNNTYSVVKFITRWTWYPSYDNKANLTWLLQKVMENTSSLHTWLTCIRPNTIVLTSDGNITSLSECKHPTQNTTQNMTKHHCCWPSDGNTSSLLHFKMQQMIYKRMTMKWQHVKKPFVNGLPLWGGFSCWTTALPASRTDALSLRRCSRWSLQQVALWWPLLSQWLQ